MNNKTSQEIRKERLEEVKRLFNTFKERLKLRVAKVFFSALALIIFVLVLLPQFFSFVNLEKKIEEELSKKIAAKIDIKGDIALALVPSPRVVVKNIFISDFKLDSDAKNLNAFVQELHIKFSPNFIFNSASISEIEALYPVVQLTQSSVEVQNYQDAYEVIKSRQTDKTDADQKVEFWQFDGEKLAFFNFKNFSENLSKAMSFEDKRHKIVSQSGLVIFYQDEKNKRQLDGLFFKAQIEPEFIKLKGKFVSEGVASNLDLAAFFDSKSKEYDSKLLLKSEVLNLQIDGKFLSKNLGLKSSFSGKMSGEIKNFSTFLKTYFSNNELIWKKFKNDPSAIKITSEIFAENGDINLENFAINSEFIKGVSNLEIALSEANPKIDVDVDLEYLNLDRIWSNESVKFEQPILEKVSSFFESDNADDYKIIALIKEKLLGIAPEQKSEVVVKKDELVLHTLKNIDLNFEAKIAEIEFLGKNSSKASLYLNLAKDGSVIISPFMAYLPDGSLLRINGVFEDNKSYPKLIAKIYVDGRNLADNLTWLGLENEQIKFSSLSGSYQLSSDLMMLPNLIKMDGINLVLGEEKMQILGNLEMKNDAKTPHFSAKFVFDKVDFDKYFKLPNFGKYLNNGTLISKAFNLNNVASELDLELSFDEMIYAEETYQNQNLALNISPGKFSIKNINFQTDVMHLAGNLDLDISGEKPVFNINLNSDYFYLEPNAQNPKAAQNLTEAFFNLPSLEKFSGTISLKFAGLEDDNLYFENFAFLGELKDGAISNAKISADAFGGKIDYKGQMELKSGKILSGNLLLQNVDLADFISSAVDVENISGRANISANFNSGGNNKAEFLRNLTAASKFNIANLGVKNFALSDLNQKMLSPKANMEELSRPEDLIFTAGAQTQFAQASGSLNFEKSKAAKISTSIKSQGVNAVFSGDLDILDKKNNLKFNAIFLVGTKQKAVPINVAINLSGNLLALEKLPNMDQVRQYLGLKKINFSSTAQSIESNNIKPQELNHNQKAIDSEVQKIIEKSVILPPQLPNYQAIPQQNDKPIN